MSSGTISKDFPLYHSNLIPTYQNPEEKNYIHKRSEVHDIYTNEHPDIFRLEGMKEGGYCNPYLNEVIKVDRSEYLKKLSLDRKKINFIDFIKSNRKYSQDPKLIRYIDSNEDTELRYKRMGKENLITEKNDIYDKNEKEYNNNLSYSKNNSNYRDYITLTEENNKNKKEYNNLIKKLNFFIPKIDYKMKKTLDLSNEENKSKTNSINQKDNIYKKLINKNIKYVTNLRNINTYQVNSSYNKDNEINLSRKQISQYNPIKDKIEVFSPPPLKKEKWSPFLENYFLKSNTRKKFQRTGGLLSEFCNKNIISINNEKYDIRQKLQKEKEKKENDTSIEKRTQNNI